MDLFNEIFNEAEHLISSQISIEPTIDTVIVPEHKRRKRKVKQDEDLMNFDSKVIEHILTCLSSILCFRGQKICLLNAGRRKEYEDKYRRQLPAGVCISRWLTFR